MIGLIAAAVVVGLVYFGRGQRKKHGFALRLLLMESGSEVAVHTRAEAEVIFVHSGNLEMKWDGGSITLGAGDTLTIPIGLARSFHNSSPDEVVAYVVRGSDNPKAPSFVAKEAAE